jgi:hypothetical protein
MPDWISREFLLAVIISLSVALATLLWTGPPYQGEQPPGQQGGQHSETQESKPQSGHGPISLQVECNPNCSAKKTNEQGDQSRFSRFIDKSIDDPVAAFTLFLALATLFLVAAVLMQVSDARISSERQLRAYVVVSFTGCEVPATANGVFVFQIRINNSGQTPAFDLKILARSAIITFPIPDDFDFTLPDRGDASKGMLGPLQDTGSETASDPMTPDGWQAITRVESGRRLCSYGTVTYRDGFGQRRYTNFCVIQVAEVVDRNRGAIRITGQTADRHNDAN